MNDDTIRLDKFLANQGICSRRNIKQLLKENSLTVNGQRVRESGTRLRPTKDDIRLNGNKIKPPKLVYYLVNKPKGIVSTTADEFGRKNITSLVPATERIYPVGRLDKDTTGLILLTNDGEFTNLLTHPRYHVYKVYRLKIEGKATKEQIHAFRSGVLLEDGITAPAKANVIKESNDFSIIEVTLHEGKNRQIRRMCESVGMKLFELKRIQFGPIGMHGIPEGKYRELTDREISLLRDTAQQTTSLKEK